MIDDARLSGLLDRTMDFHAAIGAYVSQLVPEANVRNEAAFHSALISLNHGMGVAILIEHAINPAAYALARPQYESLVRGIWLAYSASAVWVNRFGSALTPESAEQANKSPDLKAMLSRIERGGNVPEELVRRLRRCHGDGEWEALNSYTHAGLHPLSRSKTGYPPDMSCGFLRTCNARVVLATQLAAILTSEQRDQTPISRLYDEFVDCMVDPA